MAIDLDVVTRLNRATAREAAREAQQYFKDAGDGAGKDFGDGLSKGLTSKVPEVEKALKKVTDASGKVIVEQEKLNALKEKSNTTDSQMIAQSEKLRKAHADEAAAINAVNRALDDHSNKTRKLGDDIMGATAKIGDLGGALRGLGAVGALGSLPAVATAITSVAGALQQLSGAALAGPGIFAGIAASAGTAALGMQGMSDAFTASIKAMDGTKASVEAANKALAELSPNAADAVKTIVGLKGTFTDLRDVSSQNMFAGFSDGLRGLAGNLLPTVTRGVDGISKGLNQNLLQAFSSLGSSSSQGFLDRILGNTGDAQSKLTAAISPIVHAVGVLTAAGSDTLPRLAEAIGSVADRFNTFITNADNSGNLSKWIDQGITGFTQLGNIALNIGKTFTALTDAAGGGTGLLGTLESATDKLQTFLNSTQGQDQLRQYFAQGRDMLSQLKDIAVSAGPVLGGMFQAASTATQMWLPVIKQILDIINSIPGGAQGVVAAFVAWESIKGIASVATGLNSIVNILKFVLPGAAAEGAAGITTAFAGITLPGWLSAFLAAGGSIAALPAAAAGFAVLGQHMYDNATPDDKRIGNTNVTTDDIANARTGGRGSRASEAGQPQNPYAGGGGSFANPAPTLSRGALDRQHENVDNIPLTPPAPGLSSYSSPVITEPDKGSGAAATPYIDPAKFAVGNPLANMPAPSPNADPQAVYEADSRALTAANNLAQGKLALAVLEAKGTATQQELLTAKNNLAEQERALYDAQAKDLEARKGQMSKASGDLQSIFAPLDQDFGISGGIPGIVKNLVTFLGNTALAGAIASSPTLQAAAMDLMNPQTGATSPIFSGYGASAMGSATFGGGLGMPGGGAPSEAQVKQIAASFGLKVTSEDRPGDPGYHGKGMALDLSNGGANTPEMKAFADYMAQNFGGSLKELIYSDPGFTGLIGDGKNVTGSGYYSSGTLADHRNHVHVAADWGQGGGVGASSAADKFWDAIAAKESSGNWQNPDTGGSGHYGGLQFSPSTWNSFGGQEFAAMPHQATREQQIAVADRTAFTGYNGTKPQGLGAWEVITNGSTAADGITANSPRPTGGPVGMPISTGSPFSGAAEPSSSILGGLPLPLPVTIVGGVGPGIPGPSVPGGPGAPAPGAPGMPPAPGTPVPGSVGGPPSDIYAPSNTGPGLNNPAAPAAAPAATPGGWANPGIPGSVTGGGGQGPVLGSSPKGPGLGASAGFQAGGVAPQGSSGGGGFGGLGGMPMEGLMAATSGLDLIAPGAGQAAKIGIQLANRAIAFGGQAAGIGVSGLFETLLPSGSALGNFGNSWFGKIAGGFAGARPAKPNAAAGQGAKPPQQGGQQGEQGGAGQAAGQPINVTYNNNNATEDRAGADLTNHLSTMNSTPSPISPRG